MKKITITFLTLLIAIAGIAQDIAGSWNGKLGPLRVVLNIQKSDTGYNVTLDSPDQGAKGIPVSEFTYNNPDIHLKIDAVHAAYTGEYKTDSLTGTFTQGSKTLPLTFVRGFVEPVKHPQEPTLPLPYYSEEVTFEDTQAHVTLAGTLTLPRKTGSYPAVILITGSGQQNRDEELLGHKPFLIISDYLTRQGIAVLRYDDRGVAKSTGDFKSATSLDFANDVESAIAYLKTRKEIKQIGLIGHSEGGLIAPIVAARNKNVAFIVMLAGTGIRGDELLLKQTALVLHAQGTADSAITKINTTNKGAFDIILNNDDDSTIKRDLTSYYKQLGEGNPEEEVKEMMHPWPWIKFFMKYDPTTSLRKVHCPVLAVNGDKDLQVPAKDNLPKIAAALKEAGNKDATIKEYEGLNHLFQECKTGSPTEYARIEQTFSPLVLEEITKWIKIRTVH